MSDPSAFSGQSLATQVVFTIVTFGLYPIWWSYKTAKMLDRGTNQNLSPILAFIPFGNIILYWQIAEASEPLTDQDAMPTFLLFLFFGIISWYWVQSGINAAVES
ncbi:DUF4234 domain-containing protein [Halorubellus sp. JP-L1]|nr:DUF4234 domain-containing protein [Halorubellus sp. JP-L1]